MQHKDCHYIFIKWDSVDFTVANSLRSVLGFNAAVYTATSAGYNLYSPNTATFNSDNSYIIQSNLLSAGIPINNQQIGILVNVPINSSPGSQIIYQPANIVWVNAPELIGNPRQYLTFTLQNQNLAPVNTLGETYQFTLCIRYQVKL